MVAGDAIVFIIEETRIGMVVVSTEVPIWQV